jgi:hypothetical protein
MKLNLPPPDPTQKSFDWMPTVHLHAGGFSAGLVIYWACQHALGDPAVDHHAKHGAKIELLDNLREVWRKIKSLVTKKKDDD